MDLIYRLASLELPDTGLLDKAITIAALLACAVWLRYAQSKNDAEGYSLLAILTCWTSVFFFGIASVLAVTLLMQGPLYETITLGLIYIAGLLLYSLAGTASHKTEGKEL